MSKAAEHRDDILYYESGIKHNAQYFDLLPKQVRTAINNANDKIPATDIVTIYHMCREGYPLSELIRLIKM